MGTSADPILNAGIRTQYITQGGTIPGQLCACHNRTCAIHFVYCRSGWILCCISCGSFGSHVRRAVSCVPSARVYAFSCVSEAGGIGLLANHPILGLSRDIQGTASDVSAWAAVSAALCQFWQRFHRCCVDHFNHSGVPCRACCAMSQVVLPFSVQLLCF